MIITLQDAVAICRVVEPKLRAIGYHCALTGSCLYAGLSRKDVDILLYPHDPKKSVSDDVIADTLEDAGFTIRYETDLEYVNRQVWLAAYQGTRVDFFLR